LKETTRDFFVGSGSIVALVGLGALMMWFGELEWLFEKRYELTINTDHAAGLQPGSRVELNGVRIGVIDDLTILETPADPRYPLEFVVLINEGIRVPQDVVLRATEPLIAGGATLRFFVEDMSTAGPALPTDGTAMLVDHIRTPLEEITAELDLRMEPVVRALEDFDQLADTYLALGRNLNELVRPQGTDGVDGQEPNIRTAVTRLNQVLARADEALTLARDWLGDEQLRANTKSAIEKATTLIDKATSAVNRFAELADNLEADADDLAKRTVSVFDQLSVTLEEIHRLTRLATEGEGTIAQLLKNPDLYNALHDSAVRLERAIDEATLLMQKFRAEGIPVHF
jgi:ABC-type transporter Mla subunit MlaD